MALPYQCLETAFSSQDGIGGWLLLGASGADLVLQSSTGASSTWSADIGTSSHEANENEEDGPPGKKVKLSPLSETAPSFTCLTLSHSRTYLATVTAEDKCIRVFELNPRGSLRQLSQRCMARRPCSLVITSDDSTILCADKFGDVYALPLLQASEDDENDVTSPGQDSAADGAKFHPAATVLTVHSGRNRKVLEEQIKQASFGQVKKREPLKFKHELLLGHVSMLTDIVSTYVDGHSYIITADRDEHIRISRGIPQAHIIEGFCHGHESFVSRLCLIPNGLLVSGGGDPHLYVWDWRIHRLQGKIALRDAALQYLKSESHLALNVPGNETDFKIAVRGIWSVPYGDIDGSSVLVACEGLPVLFNISIGQVSTIEQIISLNGNVLDVAFVSHGQGSCTAVISVDNVHIPGSTTEIRKDKIPTRLQCLSRQKDGRWQQGAAIEERLEWFSRNAGRAAGGGLKAVPDTLYTVENLRKRPGAED